MVSASTEKQINEIDKATFKDELQRSILLNMNKQIENQPESRTVDGYKTHLELLSKRLKSKGRQTDYTACMIGQCVSELKQKYQGNKKLFICATKHLLTISYVYFVIDLFNFATTYYRISGISLPLAIVRRQFKLIKEIVNEDEDFWMNGYERKLNAIFIIVIKKYVLTNVVSAVLKRF